MNLFKIEDEGNHLGPASVNALGELQQRLIDKVAAVVHYDIAQAKAEA